MDLAIRKEESLLFLNTIMYFLMVWKFISDTVIAIAQKRLDWSFGLFHHPSSQAAEHAPCCPAAEDGCFPVLIYQLFSLLLSKFWWRVCDSKLYLLARLSAQLSTSTWLCSRHHRRSPDLSIFSDGPLLIKVIPGPPPPAPPPGPPALPGPAPTLPVSMGWTAPGPACEWNHNVCPLAWRRPGSSLCSSC